MLKTEDIRIRDPFIVAYNGMYYMYGSHRSFEPNSEDRSLYMFKSEDLCNWEGPQRVFTIAPDSWALCELWAPEVHYYKGKFYIFVSIRGKHGHRGTQIAVSDTPDGVFEPIKNGPATPFERDCIDGTLYVEDGTPYIVYSADWPDNYEAEQDRFMGRICAVQLTEDLKDEAGEPFLLFNSADSPISAKTPATNHYNGRPVSRYGSDAPFISKLSDGTLFLTWSPLLGTNYVVISAYSDNGSIKGKWIHNEEAVFDQNGGHAMFFEKFSGEKMMCIHCPERAPDERAMFIEVEEKDGKIVCKSRRES